MFIKPRKGNKTYQYTGVGSIEEDIPLDILGLVAIYIEMFGSIIATYATGTPVARRGSVMNSIISAIRVTVGGDTFKSASPEAFRLIQMFVEGQAPTLRATAGGTATDKPMTDIVNGASVPHGTTTQYMNFSERLKIHIACPYFASLAEQLSTVVRTKGHSSATIELVQQEAKNLLAVGNTAPVTYSGLSGLKFRFDYEEMKEDKVGELDNKDFVAGLEKYRTVEKTDTVKGQESALEVKQNGGNGRVLGIIIKQRDGAAGSPTTDTGKIPNDNIIQEVNFYADDERYMGGGNWETLKTIQKNKFKYLDPKTNGVSEDSGVASIWWVNQRKKEAFDLTNTATFKAVLKTAAQATDSDYGASGAVTKYITEYLTTK